MNSSYFLQLWIRANMVCSDTEGKRPKREDSAHFWENWELICLQSYSSFLYLPKCSPEKVAIAPMVGLEVLQVCLLAIQPMGRILKANSQHPRFTGGINKHKASKLSAASHYRLFYEGHHKSKIETRTSDGAGAGLHWRMYTGHIRRG